MRVKLDKGILKLDGEVEYAEETEVDPVGNGAKIGSYKRFLGRKVFVLVLKNPRVKR